MSAAATIEDVLSGAARWAVVGGDSGVVARGIPDCSIDAIASDPPAGIAFMGKEWDGDRGGKEHWIEWLSGILREAYRVLKPGGHIVLWALPRTSHWTAEALDRAGFQIRDVLVHVFSTGFPKSLSIEKAIGGENGAKWAGWGTSLKPANERWVTAQKPIAGQDDPAIISERINALEKLLCSANVRHAASKSRRSRVSSKKEKDGSVPVHAATHREDERQSVIQTGEAVASSEAMGTSPSAQREDNTILSIVSSWRRTWVDLCERTSMFTTETASSLTTELKTLRLCLSRITPENIIQDESSPSGPSSLASDVERSLQDLQTTYAAIQTSAVARNASPSSCAEKGQRLPMVVPEMQPVISSEDWILARKPLDGTVAANVLRHGTGGINVDAGRVGTDTSRGDRYNGKAPGGGGSLVDFGGARERLWDVPQGRFPSNLILSHFAFEQTVCRACSLALPFIARFCPGCGSGNVEHGRDGCREVGERRVRAPGGEADYTKTGIQGPTSIIPNVKTGRHYGGSDGLETVAAWECVASCNGPSGCGATARVLSGGAPPRCVCGQAMRWACPVARMDEQSGERPGFGGFAIGAERKATAGGGGYSGGFPKPLTSAGYDDTGGASRFFHCLPPPDNTEPFAYVAKPSASETEAGCEALPLRSAAENVDREEGSAGMDSPRAGAGRLSGRRNHHSTKKPIELMRKLIVMITPPGGIVLDLFGGSGTTVCAAVLDGFRCIAIELDPEYVAIARARATFWARLAGTRAASVAKPRPVRDKAPEGQGKLFA